jgi:hypothetical protein
MSFQRYPKYIEGPVLGRKTMPQDLYLPDVPAVWTLPFSQTGYGKSP